MSNQYTKGLHYFHSISKWLKQLIDGQGNHIHVVQESILLGVCIHTHVGVRGVGQGPNCTWCNLFIPCDNDHMQVLGILECGNIDYVGYMVYTVSANTWVTWHWQLLRILPLSLCAHSMTCFQTVNKMTVCCLPAFCHNASWIQLDLNLDVSVSIRPPPVALNLGFPSQILSHSFRENLQAVWDKI